MLLKYLAEGADGGATAQLSTRRIDLEPCELALEFRQCPFQVIDLSSIATSWLVSTSVSRCRSCSSIPDCWWAMRLIAGAATCFGRARPAVRVKPVALSSTDERGVQRAHGAASARNAGRGYRPAPFKTF